MKLKIENLHKQYGSVKVLKGINIELEEGEFLALVGSSGCGKSTLLSCIAGLEDPSSGAIYFGDKRLDLLPPKNREIAMVFQSYALYPNMTVRENIEFGLKIAKYPRDQIEKRVKEAASTLEISELLNRKPSALSGGQRQRVAIARAISREPKIYLFDEPLSNLDAKLRVYMRTEIKKLHKAVGKSIVYVTHDQVEAMTLADKIAVLNEGVLQQFDSPAKIYDDPNSLFIAGFIGSPSMNFIKLLLQKDANGVFIELENALGKVKKIYLREVGQNTANYAGKEVVVGIRPEHIQNGFRDANVLNELEEIEVRVDFSELIGSDAYLYFKLNGQNAVARVSPSGQVEDNATSVLKIWWRKILLFDPRTGKRIRG